MMILKIMSKIKIFALPIFRRHILFHVDTYRNDHSNNAAAAITFLNRKTKISFKERLNHYYEELQNKVIINNKINFI